MLALGQLLVQPPEHLHSNAELSSQMHYDVADIQHTAFMRGSAQGLITIAHVCDFRPQDKRQQTAVFRNASWSAESASA